MRDCSSRPRPPQLTVVSFSARSHSRLMFDICVFGEDKVNGRRTGKMDKRGRPETRLQDSDIASCQTVLQQVRLPELYRDSTWRIERARPLVAALFALVAFALYQNADQRILHLSYAVENSFDQYCSSC